MAHPYLIVRSLISMDPFVSAAFDTCLRNRSPMLIIVGIMLFSLPDVKVGVSFALQNNDEVEMNKTNKQMKQT